MTDLGRSVLRPRLRDGMEQRMDTTPFDDMLKYMLSLCVRDGVTVDKDTLLKDCLEDVFSLCENKESDLVKTLVKQYDRVAYKEDPYAPFGKLVNKAFDKLDTLTGKGASQLRFAPKWNEGEAVMLVQNDSKAIADHHSGDETDQSPKLTVISEHAAERVYPEFTKEAQALGASSSPRVDCKCLEKAPQHAELEWPEIKAVFELKVSETLQEPQPPYVKPVKCEKFEYPPRKDGMCRKIRTESSGKAPHEDQLGQDPHEDRPGKAPYERQPAPSGSLPPTDANDTHEQDTFDRESQLAPVTGCKRKTLASDFENSAKAKKQKGNVQCMPYDIKMGSYATERLCCLPCVMHTIEIFVHDEILWVFWFDRQGVIQTDGLNWVADFPRFLVLLLAFQRFNRRNWGVPDVFPERIPMERKLPNKKAASTNRFTSLQEHVSNLDLHFPKHVDELVPSDDPDVPTESVITPATTVSVDWSTAIYRKYQLFGRATQVYPGQVDGLEDELVVKISFPDKSRVPEPRIIRIAQHADVEPNDVFNVRDHLPGLVCTMDIPGCDTGDVRESLGLMKTDKEHARRRVVRVSVFVKLEEIYTLGGLEFIECFLDIVHCHYVLWGAGVHHNDPSLANIGVRKIGDKYYGVLNDWDLATIVGLSTCFGLDRTGTLPFTALELLCNDFWEGRLARLYRHDLEGYTWKLSWIFLQYDEENKCQYHPRIAEWTVHELPQLYSNKAGFLLDRGAITPLQRWEEHWPLAVGLMGLIQNATGARKTLKNAKDVVKLDMMGFPKPPPPPPLDLEFSREVEYHMFWIVFRREMGEMVYDAMRTRLGLPLEIPALPPATAIILDPRPIVDTRS